MSLEPLPAGTDWVSHAPGTVYRCEAYLSESGGRFTAVAATLSGVSAEGGSQQEALEALTRALITAISGWKQQGAIPWTTTPAPAGALTRYVIVRL